MNVGKSQVWKRFISGHVERRRPQSESQIKHLDNYESVVGNEERISPLRRVVFWGQIPPRRSFLAVKRRGGSLKNS